MCRLDRAGSALFDFDSRSDIHADDSGLDELGGPVDQGAPVIITSSDSGNALNAMSSSGGSYDGGAPDSTSSAPSNVGPLSINSSEGEQEAHEDQNIQDEAELAAQPHAGADVAALFAHLDVGELPRKFGSLVNPSVPDDTRVSG
jgi:hypothetical protein